MNTQTVQSVLRIIAVTSALVGAIATSATLLIKVSYSLMLARLQAAHFTAADNWTTAWVVASAMPALWGAALYLASPKIAAHILGDARRVMLD